MSEYGYRPIEWMKYTNRSGYECRVQMRHCCDMSPSFDGAKVDGTYLKMVNGDRIWAQEPIDYFITGRLPKVDPKAMAERLA